MATVERPRVPASSATDAGRRGTQPETIVKPPRPLFLRSWFALVLIVVMIAAHVYGWFRAEIDPARLVQKSPDIARFTGQVLSPDLISHDQASIEQQVGVLGAANPVDVKPVESGGIVVPSVSVGDTPKDTPADIGSYNVNVTVSANTVAPGQEITVSGTGFKPSSSGEILWRSTGASASVQNLGAFVSDAKGDFSAKVKLPEDTDRVINTSGFANTLAVQQTWDYGSAYPSEALRLSGDKIIETIFLALMGTTFSVIVSVPLSFLASRNLMSHTILGNATYFTTRTILNILRAIEVVIWAVIFAATVGLGPFAGMLALTIHSIASLGKLYSEAIEQIDPGPMEALTATGANRLQVIMYAVIPQFIPQFLSFTMYRWDINVRMSTIVGIVGGGGIGYILNQYISLLKWNQAGTAILLIAIVVVAMDFISSAVRKAVI